jgi:hypothetical protein
MAEDSEDFFVPIVDEDGRVTGVMDQMAADYLASTEPDPTQASLDAAFDGVTRVRLVGPPRLDSDVIPDEVVRVDVSDPESLAELACALRIFEADEFGHLMSPGLNRLELWVGDRHAHTLELPDWDSIRWPLVWKGDANLAEPKRFEDWLLCRGVPDARDSREESEQRYAEWFRSTENWERAMPHSLRPLWPDRLGDGPGNVSPADVDAAEALLQTAVPDPVARVRALYEWFGSGKGPWSGYPSYEGAAEQLLLACQIEVLLAALDASTDNPAAAYGAARLFGGWDFGQTRRADRKRCPEPLRQRMLDAVIWHGNSDNLGRFRSAFDLPGT